jgi:hydroxymethylpyrimidine pyrophosphatase-like HAD family hydrolase
MTVSSRAAEVVRAQSHIGAAQGRAAGQGQSSQQRWLSSSLLHTLSELTAALPTLIAQGAWLDAFLVAAGSNQIVEDFLHPDPLSAGSGAKYIERLHPRLGPPAGHAIRATAGAVATLLASRRQGGGIAEYQENLGLLVEGLSSQVISQIAPGRSNAGLPLQALALARDIQAQTRLLPIALQRDQVRLPSCFHSFDLCPDDIGKLVERFVETVPRRQRRILVVGLRTSGSYLAPLIAAWLRHRDYDDVAVMTHRPGRRLLQHERRRLRTAREGAVVVLTDDPPASGASIAQAAAELERAGTARPSIVLLLPIFGAGEPLPALLQAYQRVLLPWNEWSIHDKLQPEHIKSALQQFQIEGDILAVHRLSVPPRPDPRGHLSGRYSVELGAAGEAGQNMEIHVQGAGLGYFAGYAATVAETFAEFLPKTFGLLNGMFYRAWLPTEQRLDVRKANLAAVAGRIVAYCLAHRDRLRIPDDVTLRLGGRGPAWERAAEILTRPFGQPGLILRPLMGLWTQQMLRSAVPAVIDGTADEARWFFDRDGQHALVKVDFFEGAFSNRDYTCCDPVFDLADTAAVLEESPLPNLLRGEYERTANEHVGDEKWLLYRWMHLQRKLERSSSEVPEVRRALSRLLQEYIAGLYLDDLSASATGAVCAIDIDGVLETDQLGFSAMPPAGARTLRALLRHGYRPILVSGRSLDEVRERCRVWRLPGGISEYGAGLYETVTDGRQHLVTPAQQTSLEQLRRLLARMSGVRLDPAYLDSVRAYRWDNAKRRRRGLPPELARAALVDAKASGEVRAIEGQDQTDFVPLGVDKGSGVKTLLRLWNSPTLQLAVGDSLSDLPMLALAQIAYAPADCNPRLRAHGVNIARQPGALGLVAGASKLLGHAPGRCSTCRVPKLSSDAHVMLTALGALDGGRWPKIWRTFELASLLVRRPSPS